MVNVLWTPIERIIGRGVEIHGLSAQSPLAKALLEEGDTLLEADGKKLKTPDDLIQPIEQKEITRVKFYRPDFYYTVEVKRANLLSGANTFEKLGITDWKKSRNWRSAGFYGHYTTYAEVLQLIAALVFGLFIALGKKRSRRSAVLLFCLLGMTLALFLTVTRASQLGFLAAAFAIVLVNGNRKMLLTLALIALPLTVAALIFVQQSRQVGFFDQKDDSTIYRQTVYKEGFNLWTKDARNFFLGVGMDSIQRYAKEWRLFDDGKLPMGHFHSTPLQLLVERGLPALLLWLWVLWRYGKTLLNYLRIENRKSKIENPNSSDWQKKGIILGGFGSLVGFFTSGLVHFNLGDAEVAMVFFMLMGLSVSLVILDSKCKIENLNLES
jgi:O-antigen ligase